jgi:hypothetical protein
LGTVLDFARGRSGYLQPIASAYFKSDTAERVALFVGRERAMEWPSALRVFSACIV